LLRPNVIVATAWWPSFEPCAVGAWGVETRCSLGRLFLPLVPPEWILDGTHLPEAMSDRLLTGR
jgi:hypothetical protein